MIIPIIMPRNSGKTAKAKLLAKELNGIYVNCIHSMPYTRGRKEPLILDEFCYLGGTLLKEKFVINLITHPSDVYLIGTLFHTNFHPSLTRVIANVYPELFI